MTNAAQHGKRKRVVVLGSTGSIGTSALKVAEDIPERMEIVGLAAHRSVRAMAAQAKKTGVRNLAMWDEESAGTLSSTLGPSHSVRSGEDGLLELATLPEADMVLIAIVGTSGLRPALAALEAGKDIAVASKEILVMAGETVMEAARRNGCRVLPVDSEHNAIFQCLEGRDTSEVTRIILTASGGPFRNLPADQLASVTLDQALKHPTWDMGKEDHHRFRNAFQQGAGDDRGSLALRHRDGPRRSHRASPEYHPFDGRVRRRIGIGSAESLRHVFPPSNMR